MCSNIMTVQRNLAHFGSYSDKSPLNHCPEFYFIFPFDQEDLTATNRKQTMGKKVAEVLRQSGFFIFEKSVWF